MQLEVHVKRLHGPIILRCVVVSLVNAFDDERDVFCFMQLQVHVKRFYGTIIIQCFVVSLVNPFGDERGM